jgi:pantoate--beta-alanine ligase
MLIFHDRQQLRDHVRSVGGEVALVPTMGNLHAGHEALMRRAGELAPHVVVSIFVNPTQFGPTEDFATYPRTEAEDLERCRAQGVHAVFLPDVVDLYPDGIPGTVRIGLPQLENDLCGAFRPGHFAGVALVVMKLLGLVTPQTAVFGKKDYQQLLVVRTLARELCLPTHIEPVPTVREEDGLALSSRNRYLSTAERRLAPQLYTTLQQLANELSAVQQGDIGTLERWALERLAMLGFLPEYVAIRRASDLQPLQVPEGEMIILAAVKLGKTRLIDNLEVQRS